MSAFSQDYTILIFECVHSGLSGTNLATDAQMMVVFLVSKFHSNCIQKFQKVTHMYACMITQWNPVAVFTVNYLFCY